MSRSNQSNKRSKKQQEDEDSTYNLKSSSADTGAYQSTPLSTIRKRRSATIDELCVNKKSKIKSTRNIISMRKRVLRSNPKNSSVVSKAFYASNNYKTKTYLYVGCNKRFSQFKSPSQFIKKHMEMNHNYKKAIVYCQYCNSGFIDKGSLMSHLNKSNQLCRKFYDQKAISNSIASSFSASEVTIASNIGGNTSNKGSEDLKNKSVGQSIINTPNTASINTS